MLIGIIQARMSSRRFPGKVLEPLGGRPMLLEQVARVGRSRLDAVVVATSAEPSDDALADAVRSAGVAVHRGALDDVLDRVRQAAVAHGARHVVRLTADCPLIDHRIVDAVVERHLESGADYTSNTLTRSYPDGQDVEVVRIESLETACREATRPYDREHVTPYVYTRPERFRLASVESPEDLSALRWTVDYPEDLVVVREIFDRLSARRPDFGLAEMLELCAARPELARINARHNAYG